MSTEQKAETTPATAKANGKRKIKKENVSEKAPIAQSSSSNPHNHQSNGAKLKLKSKSKSSEEEQLVEVYVEEKVVDHDAQVPAAANGIVASKKKNEKTKKMKEEKDESLLYQIPMSRLSRIIRSEDPNVRITQEAVYVINKASEKFLQEFTTEAYASTFLEHKKYIDYKHLSSVVSKRRRFDFLSDFVPEKVKAEDALVESQAFEN
ncbi:hypothetical protein L1987_86562 [Smallanthus sonchifolius]|uniref:Uncharacterized protein n=1 Tax=Smallanthus sonchifolius TaxID=185202 RepID=A0ACB8Y098_9ASTR|nr:hypothetical protein L1987_86562 [Smallanthus sonchifolius]